MENAKMESFNLNIVECKDGVWVTAYARNNVLI